MLIETELEKSNPNLKVVEVQLNNKFKQLEDNQREIKVTLQIEGTEKEHEDFIAAEEYHDRYSKIIKSENLMEEMKLPLTSDDDSEKEEI